MNHSDKLVRLILLPYEKGKKYMEICNNLINRTCPYSKHSIHKSAGKGEAVTFVNVEEQFDK